MTKPLIDTFERGALSGWRIVTEHAELLIARQGAHVLSYQRTGEPPLLWLSDQALFKAGKSVRGGVPVCWPWFGNLQRNPAAVQAEYHGAEAPAHGLVRGRDWTLSGIEEHGNDVSVRLSLPEAQQGLPGWPHKVELTLLIELGERLRLTLTSRNLDDHPLTLSQALHSYFAVSDVREVQVPDVAGLDYLETLQDWAQQHQHGALTFSGETDRIYLQPPKRLGIVDPGHGRRITLDTQGSRSAVIWNPWTERAAELPDMAAEGWQGMLCIETANAWDDIITLAPGASHSLSVIFASEPL